MVALVLQWGIPYISIDKYKIDKEIVQKIPQGIAQKNILIALDCIGSVLSVVMANPLNQDQVKDVEKATGCQVAVFISTKKEILSAIKKSYPSE